MKLCFQCNKWYPKEKMETVYEDCTSKGKPINPRSVCHNCSYEMEMALVKQSNKSKMAFSIDKKEINDAKKHEKIYSKLNLQEIEINKLKEQVRYLQAYVFKMEMCSECDERNTCFKEIQKVIDCMGQYQQEEYERLHIRYD